MEASRIGTVLALRVSRVFPTLAGRLQTPLGSPSDSRGWGIGAGCLLALVLVLVLPQVIHSGEAEGEMANLEKALTAEGISSDGPSLLAYLKERTLSDSERQRLAQLVRQLGDDSFARRETATVQLTSAGRQALTHLTPAVYDKDLEIRWRAKQCIARIEARSDVSHVGTVIRLLALKNPEGTTAALLDFLPGAHDPVVEEQVFAALARVGVQGQDIDPALAAGLTDAHPLRRAAAARVLSRAPDPQSRQTVVPLLQDPQPRVRFEAATGLIISGHREAVATLWPLLTDAPAPLAWQVEDLLFRLARGKGPVGGLGPADPARRKACRAAWETWWRNEGDKVDLVHLEGFHPVRGLTLVCDYDEGRVLELDRQGKVRWQITGLAGPNDAHILPGGRVLIAERNGRVVTERDRRGKIVWEHRARNNPIACQRLENGNTLVVTWSEIYEVTPTQEVVKKHSHRSGFRHAQQLPNGHLLYITSRGEVVELDGNWKPLRTITLSDHAHGAGYWASIDPLPGDRFLIALGGAGRVLEIDSKGEVIWEHAEHSPVFATRLRNGNTLISSFDGRYLVEVDHAGKEVAKHKMTGRPFAARRY
jgi:HEAT repeat protein